MILFINQDLMVIQKDNTKVIQKITQLLNFVEPAPSVMEKINDKLTSGKSVSSTYTNLVRECSDTRTQGGLNPRNRQQVKNA